MKKLRIFSVLLLIASTAAFIAFQVYTNMVQDNVPPVVTCETEEITVSVDAPEADLFEGVTAKDNRSGDVTGTLVVEEMSAFTEDGKRVITYAAVDESKNVGRCERVLSYEGYKPPTFDLVGPLSFPVGQKTSIASLITAKSVLDGNLSENIKYTLETAINSQEEGTYPIEFRVMDSGGKNVYLKTEIEIYEREYASIAVTLEDYLVYVKKGADFSARKYYKGASIEDVDLTINSNVNTKKEGVYYVDYIVSKATSKGKSRLVVVVQ